MKKKSTSNIKTVLLHNGFLSIVSISLISFIYLGFFNDKKISYDKDTGSVKTVKENKKDIEPKPLPPLDKEAYDLKLIEIANILKPVSVVTPDLIETSTTIPPKPELWPVKTVYPNAGAILPFKRIIAYYGNLYSKKMGALGEYPEEEMLERLDAEVKKWNIADPSTPAIPALHYIAVTAQLSPGSDGKYRLRMPGSEIDKVIKMAEKINAIVFLDIQVGFSTLEAEVPVLEKYLKLSNVHLGIDPEFSMKTGIRPGKIVGTTDAVDINFTTDYLAKIVRENNLTPKILVVHRYTQKMVTNYKQIKTLPEVQIVMHMDGWGEKAKKINTYKQFIYNEPVQFTGFKLFYKHDVQKEGSVLFTPDELLKLSPRPVYIQYQ